MCVCVCVFSVSQYHWEDTGSPSEHWLQRQDETKEQDEKGALGDGRQKGEAQGQMVGVVRRGALGSPRSRLPVKAPESAAFGSIHS